MAVVDRTAGLGLLLAWLLVVAGGFWFTIARPALAAMTSVDGAALTSQAQSWFLQTPALSKLHAASAVLVPAAGCPCSSGDETDFRALAQRWGSGDVRFAIWRPTSTLTPRSGGNGETSISESPVLELSGAAVPALPAGADLMIFDAGGRLVFAGPLQLSAVCGHPTGLAEAMLRRAAGAAAAAPPLAYGERCRCGAASGLAALSSLSLDL